MPTTKYKISEQVIRILKGSDLPNASNVRIQEVIEMVGQVCNKLLKAEHYVAMGDGDIVPNGYVIATYEEVAITQYLDVYSQLTLPAMPIRLPKNMGVFHIGSMTDPFTSFIPVPTGLMQMISDEPLISELLGQVAYEVLMPKVIFRTDLTTATPPVTEALVKLVVMDVTVLTDYDPLPIPADMEIDVIAGLLKMYGVQSEPNDKVDPVAETNKVAVK